MLVLAGEGEKGGRVKGGGRKRPLVIFVGGGQKGVAVRFLVEEAVGIVVEGEFFMRTVHEHTSI